MKIFTKHKYLPKMVYGFNDPVGFCFYICISSTPKLFVLVGWLCSMVGYVRSNPSEKEPKIVLAVAQMHGRFCLIENYYCVSQTYLHTNNELFGTTCVLMGPCAVS